MHIVKFALADDLYEILEKTFSPEEIEVFINQAVRCHIEDSLKMEITSGKLDKQDEDTNNHEWTH